MLRDHSHYIECLDFSPPTLPVLETPDVINMMLHGANIAGPNIQSKASFRKFLGFWVKRQNNKDLGSINGTVRNDTGK